MRRHRNRHATNLFRLLGTALLALAWCAGAALRHRALIVAPNRDALSWLLAAGTFLLASTGATLAVLGGHVFDRVPVARRWSRYRA